MCLVYSCTVDAKVLPWLLLQYVNHPDFRWYTNASFFLYTHKQQSCMYAQINECYCIVILASNGTFSSHTAENFLPLDENAHNAFIISPMHVCHQGWRIPIESETKKQRYQNYGPIRVQLRAKTASSRDLWTRLSWMKFMSSINCHHDALKSRLRQTSVSRLYSFSPHLVPILKEGKSQH